jgi:tetratricopeptide (TPR) repeat protein
MTNQRWLPWIALLGIVLLEIAVVMQVGAQEDNPARTVIGPSNIDLADGAAALQMGNAEDGVRLTQRGLTTAANDRERVAGYSNLCAGLIMLERFDEALDACNQAIAIDDRHWRGYSNRALAYLKLERYAAAERDIASSEAINPNARTTKVVKSMLLDATDPVAPSITIDDRRHPPTEDRE